MNLRFAALMASLGILAGESSVQAETIPSTGTVSVSSSTIAAGQVLAPGNYTFSVVPSFNGGMAKRLEKRLGSLPGIKEVAAETNNSTIRITLTNASKLKVADLQKAVMQTANGAAISEPLLQGSVDAPPFPTPKTE
jgi:hypothetical protein